MTRVDFALITIRQDELEAVLQRFPTTPYTGPSGRTYGLSTVPTKTGTSCSVAVVRVSEQGNDAAQQVAHDVIHDLDPQLLLVVGIAGGVPSDDFTLGDVIVSSRIDNLNVSKRYEDGHETNDIRGGIHPGVSNITASLQFYQRELAGWNDRASITMERPRVDLRPYTSDEFQAKIAAGQKNAAWYKNVAESLIAHFGDDYNRTLPPQFLTGTIASSNSVLRDIDVLTRWLQTARNILAVEMESAGIYTATQGIQRTYPFMAIRGISDIIGAERDNRWTKYACQSAAAFAYAFVTAGIVTPHASTPITPSAESKISAQPIKQPTYPVQTPSEPQNDGPGPVKVFISFAAGDKEFKEQFDTHLKMSQREGIMIIWHSRQTELGHNVAQTTKNHIDDAQMILLLLSPQALADDQIYEHEILYAMKRRAENNTLVVPIKLREVDLGTTALKELKALRALPREDKPVDQWTKRDQVWNDIALEIRAVAERLRAENAARRG